MKNFTLDENQYKKLNEWLVVQNKNAIQMQKNEGLDKKNSTAAENHKMGYPYMGAIGGFLTYSFTPTGLGVVIKVTHAITNEMIDLTLYDEW